MSEHDYGPRPDSIEEFVELAREKFEGPHDYNTSAEAALDVTLAAFNLAAHMLGLSGFQAGYVAISMMGRTQGWDGPYGVIKGEDMLYPQYDLEGKVREWMEEWRPWAAEQAQAKLAEQPEVVYRTVTDDDGENPMEIPNVAPTVHEHWKRLAASAPASPPSEHKQQ